MYAEVVPDIKTDRDTFTYNVSKEMETKISIGSIVAIEFGKKNIRGVVIGLAKSKKKLGYKLKSIISIDENFRLPREYILLSKWLSEYYLCSFGEAISLFLPPKIIRPRPKISKIEKNIKAEIISLTSEQEGIFKNIQKDFQKNLKPSLIFGATGSGKTEIYLALAKKIIKENKSVIILVPEIVLTPQNIKRFEKIFPDEVCVMHSKLSVSEKYHCYSDFYHGNKKIIIGPRSALLVPAKKLGLIIVDEEQEDSYKQEQNPRYDATLLAQKIAEKHKSMLVYGSATPRIETYHCAMNGKFNFYKMKFRFHQPKLPVSEIIDMRDESKKGNQSMLSEVLIKNIFEKLNNNEQVILFLNRRGAATFISCRDCGEVINCSKCLVPMIYHFGEGKDYLLCHHCDNKRAPVYRCPNCGSLKIKYFGSGIEKIDNEIRRIFPKSIVRTVDSASLKKKSDYDKFYHDFKNHKIDIVIGTQIIAKGFDIPNVALVGIISADTGLHLPFFRSRERIFRLIMQVSGRSGRREKVGKTIIQTYWPNNEAIKFAAIHDYDSFYKSEIKKRIEKKYPPIKNIVRVVSEDKNQNKARDEIRKLSLELEKNDFDFVGPGQCFFSKINNRFRFQLLIKVSLLPNKKIAILKKQFSNLVWDVDPLNLL